jgi:hypothetical protein
LPAPRALVIVNEIGRRMGPSFAQSPGGPGSFRIAPFLGRAMMRLALRTPSALFAALGTAALALASPGAAAAQHGARSADLVVTVVDAETGKPLPDATVRVTEHPSQGRTDAAGKTELRAIRPGTRVLEVSHFGYAMERAVVQFQPAAQPVEAEVELTPQPVELEGMVVTTWGRYTALRNHGFYDRQQRGGGEFFTADDLTRFQPRQMIDLFRHTTSMNVALDPKGRPYINVPRGGFNCQPLVFLDGIAVHRDQDGNVTLDMVNPESVAGIEVFAGIGNIPTEYNLTGSACGVILIWTK